MKILELTLLKESAEATSEKGEAVKEAKPHLNKISTLLFSKKCEPVVDEKRSKKPIFFGVANTRSKLVDAKGKGIKLTFDNSTDSGEFEINSLTPLKIIQGGELDKQIKSLYKKHKVSSKKKINYLDIDGEMVLREIHLGTSPNEHAVKLVRDLVKLIRGEKIEDDDEKPKEEPKEEEKPKEEKPKPKEEKPKEVKEAQDLSEAVGSPKVIQVKKKLYLCETGKTTEWLEFRGSKSNNEILMTLFPDDILVSTGKGRYVRITNSGMVEKDRAEFSDQEVAKLSSALKVVLKDK